MYQEMPFTLFGICITDSPKIMTHKALGLIITCTCSTVLALHECMEGSGGLELYNFVIVDVLKALPYPLHTEV